MIKVIYKPKKIAMCSKTREAECCLCKSSVDIYPVYLKSDKKNIVLMCLLCIKDRFTPVVVDTKDLNMNRIKRREKQDGPNS